MSQIAAGSGHAHEHDLPGVPSSPLLSSDNTQAPGIASALSTLLLLLGVAGIGGVVAFALMGGTGEDAAKSFKHALTSYHAGVMVALGLSLGCLGLVMIMHQVASGWIVTMRRQMENIASLVWVPMVMLIPTVLVFRGTLFKWIAVEQSGVYDAVLDEKKWFLNEPFYFGRVAVYFLAWLVLSQLLMRNSRKQDRTGDRWLTNKSKFLSAWGLLVFALTVAFASFDFLKALDYHWFSTMFGVYFFAGNMVASLSLIAIVMTIIVSSGKLKGLVTGEHFHDLGKLMLGFTVFWAYIGFSQYFLIWYANIPEETAWFMVRQNDGWQNFGIALIVLHFCVPFLILLFRKVKRTPVLLSMVAALIVLMQCVDIFWVVRPNLYALDHKMGLSWVDLAGMFGPVCLFLGIVLRRIGSVPLIPIKDPMLGEAMEHKNYV